MGAPLTVPYVLASAVTAGAVPRVAARVFLGLDPRPQGPEEGDGYETTGSGGEPGPRQRLSRVPDTVPVQS
ncbi:hypothetical protein SAMN06272771_7248 [Streptomyces sp. Ag82_O1-12]|uniref:hypothetical protein n=1 Tax=unclassified Streptomyces TaxID=2593676 RepID=UPI000BCA7640|nr:hypothetical protein [Streptomyces sp. Ag82_G6-1]SMQ21161.1 hypothetical protein SAMN06272771_7248 [Streptomyces sp. Ag82_O1-12]SOD49756.1 hypothetical protein SAMN06272727_7255 [Streptomyces sp. Ag82_G6-1]